MRKFDTAIAVTIGSLRAVQSMPVFQARTLVTAAVPSGLAAADRLVRVCLNPELAIRITNDGSSRRTALPV